MEPFTDDNLGALRYGNTGKSSNLGCGLTNDLCMLLGQKSLTGGYQ